MENGSVKVTYGGTFGLPGYSSAKFEIAIDVPVAPKETVEKAADRAWKMAEGIFEKKVEEALNGAEGHLRKKG